MGELLVRMGTPGDAAGIADLIRRCYGDTYPDRSALDPEHVRKALTGGALAYALALTPDGRHAGQVALEAKGSAGLFEHGRAVVDDAFRGRGLLAAMSEVLFREHAPGAGVRMVVGRSVTNHLFTQRYNVAAGFVPLGLLLGALRAGFSASGIGAWPEPVSVLLMGLRLEQEPPPRRLVLEGEDYRRCSDVLRSLGVPVTRQRVRRPGPPLGADAQRVDAMGLVHVRLSSALPRERAPDDLVARACADAERLVWVDVPAEHQDAQGAVDRLRERGFGHAAYVPLAGPGGEDVLRLQRYLDPAPLSPEHLLLLPQAHALRADVLSDVGVGAAA